MAARWPGERLRPHVKAFKSTALARRLADAGHRTFCCATVREIEGMAAAGLGDDLLLANEVLGLGAARLGVVRERRRPGHRRGRLRRDRRGRRRRRRRRGADRRQRRPPPLRVRPRRRRPRSPTWPAAAGIEVRGVMGYEGHLMREPGDTKADQGRAADGAAAGGARRRRRRRRLRRRHRHVEHQHWATELQAGSYCLMDTEYVPHAAEFANALFALAHGHLRDQRRVGRADGGLKAFGMDHGDPTVVDVGDCWFVSDEHTTFGWPTAPTVPRSATGSGCSPPTSTRPSPTTSACTSSTATRSSTCGPSTSAAGGAPVREQRARAPRKARAAVADGVLLVGASSRRTCGRRPRPGTKTGS